MKTGVMRKLHKDSQGFTLIELMIVVAIIGILAAIAIPQFAAYRIRGFNTSALSDVRNTNTGETAYFADWQVYGGTATAAVANGATAAVTGTVLTGPIAAGAGFITSNDSSSIARSQAVQAGNGVSILADTDAACDSVNIMSKHLQGDTWYAVDSDSDAIYFTQDKTNGVGSALAAGDMIAPVVTTLQFTAAATVPGAAGTAWAAK